MSKIQRKYMAHFIEAEEGKFVRLGVDLEEYSPEMSAQVEKTRNILGQTSVAVTGYEKSASVEPYFAVEGDPLFERLQQIIDGDLVLEDLKTKVVEVKLWKQAQGGFEAVQEDAYIEVTSYGGDTAGYQIPFTVHYTGNKVKGVFDPQAGTFTAE